MINFTYIDSDIELQKAGEEWQRATVIGVDVECENNLHHYGTHLSLIQLSTHDKNWIVDILKIKQPKPILELMENPKIQKIFHDVGFDLRILNRDLKCRVHNIFDTQTAALLLGKVEIGLGPLAKEYFGVEKEERFQMADWTRRPLTQEMLEYATKDSAYLIKLRDILTAELEKLGRVKWLEEHFAQLSEKDWEYKEPTFYDMKGLRDFSDRERAILKRLYILREKLAERVDRPVHFVISNKKMKELAVSPPKTLAEWSSMRGVHPVVRAWAKVFFEEVNKGKRELLPLPVPIRKRLTPAQRVLLKKISEKRDTLAAELKIPAHLIISKDQMIQVVVSGTKGIHHWQKDLLQID